MNFAAKRRSQPAVVDITPMIDVVFLLIIFFMTTAQFARLTRADVELPLEPGEQRSTSDEAGLVINITADGELIVSDRTVDLLELQTIVRAELGRVPGRRVEDLKLLIRADRSAPAGRLNSVIELLEKSGVGMARLATEVPK